MRFTADGIEPVTITTAGVAADPSREPATQTQAARINSARAIAYSFPALEVASQCRSKVSPKTGDKESAVKVAVWLVCGSTNCEMSSRCPSGATA